MDLFKSKEEEFYNQSMKSKNLPKMKKDRFVAIITGYDKIKRSFYIIRSTAKYDVKSVEEFIIAPKWLKKRVLEELQYVFLVINHLVYRSLRISF